MITYSIIIPHKDIPELLQRCLDSIPVREDTEVIVVDDNSNRDIVDPQNFPGKDRNDVRVIFTHKGGGTGYAQNVGLSYATGKCILFIGADDYFTGELNSFLDRMKDAEEDLIIFDHRSVLSSDINTSVVRSEYLSRMIDDYLCGRIDENRIGCGYIVSTCKLIRKDLIENHHIRFNETRWSNDNYFSAQVSCYANSIKVCKDVIYVMTVRDGSLTSDFCGTRKEAITRLQEAVKSERLYQQYGLTSKNVLSEPVLMAIYSRHGFLTSRGFCLSALPKWQVFTTMLRSLTRKILYHLLGKK